MQTATKQVQANSRLLVKIAITAVALLLLQIPAYYVQRLVKEKQPGQKECIAEDRRKRPCRQTDTRPVLIVPFLLTVPDSNSHSRIEKPLMPVNPGNEKQGTDLISIQKSSSRYDLIQQHPA